MAEVSPDQREKSRVAKEQGNRAFQAGDNKVALQWYTKAIQADPANAALYTNACLAMQRLHRHPEAAAMAAKSIAIDSKWVKGWCLLAQSLLVLENREAAEACLLRASAIDPGNRDVQRRLDDCATLRYFAPLLEKSALAVRRVSEGAGAGKGLFIADGATISEDTVLFSDRPLFVQQRVPTLLTCAHCLRWVGPPPDAPVSTLVNETGKGDAATAVPWRRFSDLHLFPHGLPACIPSHPSRVECEHCRRVAYCSVGCRQAAWDLHHCLLCPGGDTTGCFQQLENFLLTEFPRFVGIALLTAKMAAHVLRRFVDLDCMETRFSRGSGLDMKAESCFDRVSQLCRPPLAGCRLSRKWAERAWDLTRTGLLDALRAGKCNVDVGRPPPADLLDKAESFLSLDLYSGLAYKAKLNLQAIASGVPVTRDDWVPLLKGNIDSTMGWLERYALDDPSALLEGSGLFAVHACINHSCQPNCKCTYTPDGGMEISVVTALPAGTQLLHAYTNPEREFVDRQVRLLNWGFECRCPKCEAEGTDPENQAKLREALAKIEDRVSDIAYIE